MEVLYCRWSRNSGLSYPTRLHFGCINLGIVCRSYAFLAVFHVNDQYLEMCLVRLNYHNSRTVRSFQICHHTMVILEILHWGEGEKRRNIYSSFGQNKYFQLLTFCSTSIMYDLHTLLEKIFFKRYFISSRALLRKSDYPETHRTRPWNYICSRMRI